MQAYRPALEVAGYRQSIPIFTRATPASTMPMAPAAPRDS